MHYTQRDRNKVNAVQNTRLTTNRETFAENCLFLRLGDSLKGWKEKQ